MQTTPQWPRGLDQGSTIRAGGGAWVGPPSGPAAHYVESVQQKLFWIQFEEVPLHVFCCILERFWRQRFARDVMVWGNWGTLSILSKELGWISMQLALFWPTHSCGLTSQQGRGGSCTVLTFVVFVARSTSPNSWFPFIPIISLLQS